MVQVKCHVCDSVFLFDAQALKAMKLPATYCRRCYNSYDHLTLRQWFKLDMAIRQLQAQESWIHEAAHGPI